jgi:hypothetical protein
MPSYGMWRRVSLLGADVSEVRIASLRWGDTFFRNVGSHSHHCEHLRSYTAEYLITGLAISGIVRLH